jgi:hypothetical protein
MAARDRANCAADITTTAAGYGNVGCAQKLRRMSIGAGLV